MEWDIFYDEKNLLITVTVKGNILAAKTAEMAIQGIALAREKNCNRFLIDYRLAIVEDSTIDTYLFMSNLEKLGLTFRDNIAIIYAHDIEKHRFAETVSVNRGGPSIKYFFDMESAIRWLQIKYM